MFVRSGYFGLCLFLIALCAGCGSEGHRVSGTIKFKGQPVPGGKIYFMPDGSKGNKGPTGFADIQNGAYDTAATGRGAPGGAVVIAVEGIDPNKKPAKADAEVTTTVLFPRYELVAELPSAASTKDIDVPDSAAKGPTPPKGTGPPVVIP